MRHCFLTVALLFCHLTLPLVQAAEPYVELPRSAWLAPGEKVEVAALFSYGCRYCRELEPRLNSWVEQLPSDVHFTRIPAMAGGIWNIYGQLYLTLETLQVKPAVHAAVFEAIGNRQALATPHEMALFLVGHGVDKTVFLDTYQSFAVKVKVKEAIRKTSAFEVSNVPALVVNGKYRFDQSAGGAQGMLALAEELIARERALRN
ncbi:thiol:disulfide interchange protein DsbA/DsbL [Pseudomonas marginalis]|uniref:thiol:disulfide interchange protein DsbA/DsbL n=1 Tax=Pseudomonas marginalis TaxID=298 RepID=UPI003B9F6DB1